MKSYAHLAILLLYALTNNAFGQNKKTAFRVVAIAEKDGGVHAPFVAAAKEWLQQMATDHHFTIDYIENTDPINAAFLTKYQLFIQLNYPPYRWTDTAKAAFIQYIRDGKGGGWIGFHHAALLGEFDGYPMWPWFSEFMGGIQYKNYIPNFARATVHVEASAHPVMQGVPASFEVEKEEWYTYTKNPRPNVKVLATVDEATYVPDSEIKMGGDHPVIWSNERMKARNIYIFMGHHPDLFKNEAYKTIFRNAILWASGQK
ncbi:ThuA domain-containing protein [Larkinella harenae]